MDLFRLIGPDDVHILGIPSIFADSVCLVEWPCRLGNEFTPKERLEVCINVTEEEGSLRTVELRAYGEWWRESVEMASCSDNMLEKDLNGSPPPGMRPNSHNVLPRWPSMTKLAHVLWNGIVQPVFASKCYILSSKLNLIPLGRSFVYYTSECDADLHTFMSFFLNSND